MTQPEPLYTLDQARPLIKREQCETEGHDLQCSFRQLNGAGRVAVEHWACAHGCDVRVHLSYPPVEAPR